MSQPRTSSRYGRSALISHALAWLIAGLCVFLKAISSNSTELYTFIGTGLAAILVLEIWSLVHAYRAWMGAAFGESVRAPAMVVAVSGIEAGVCSWIMWDKFDEAAANPILLLAQDLGLPVFLPVLLISSALSGACIYAFMRFSMRRSDAALDTVALNNRRRLFVRWFVISDLALFLLLLPVPLFCFSLLVRYRSEADWQTNNPDWTLRVIRNTPVFIGDFVAEVFNDDESAKGSELRESSLASGRVRKESLLKALNTTDKEHEFDREAALKGLAKVDSALAISHARKLAINCDRSGAMLPAEVIVQYGTAEDLRQSFVDTYESPLENEYQSMVLWYLERSKQRRPVRDLLPFAQKKSFIRDELLRMICKSDSEEEVESVFVKLFESKHEPYEYHLDDYVSDDLREKILLHALGRCTPVTCISAIEFSIEGLAFHATRPEVVTRALRRLREIFDNPDEHIRRLAAVKIGDIKLNDLTDPVRLPDTEKAEREKIYDAAERWLTEHFEVPVNAK